MSDELLQTMANQVIELKLQVIHLKAKIEQLERERDANTTEPE
tara:strand:- start:2629 stop:2757 length:129 start_codon:yes stop_codon:yes gene_type:complete